jgi:uncharacterized protein (TIGR02594 family)
MNKALLYEAHRYYGIKEPHPIIAQWTAEVVQWSGSTRLPWCGIFMHIIATACGAPVPPRSLRAASWKLIGAAIPEHRFAQPGDVVVLRRAGGFHVGLFIRCDGESVWILGGNQAKSVCIKAFETTKIVAIRRLG